MCLQRLCERRFRSTQRQRTKWASRNGGARGPDQRQEPGHTDPRREVDPRVGRCRNRLCEEVAVPSRHEGLRSSGCLGVRGGHVQASGRPAGHGGMKWGVVVLILLVVTALGVIAAIAEFLAGRLRWRLKSADERALLSARACTAVSADGLKQEERSILGACSNCHRLSLTLPFRDGSGRRYCSEECLLWGRPWPHGVLPVMHQPDNNRVRGRLVSRCARVPHRASVWARECPVPDMPVGHTTGLVRPRALPDISSGAISDDSLDTGGLLESRAEDHMTGEVGGTRHAKGQSCDTRGTVTRQPRGETGAT